MRRRAATGSGDRLRVSYVWRGEVMADEVVSPAGSVTLGSEPGATFTTPDLGLPAGFAILSAQTPGGHILNLRRGMTGRICLAGKTGAVADLPGLADDDFSSAVEPGDWGVIELDGAGQHNLFFQFVPDGPPLPPARWRIDDILAPALAFAVVLHAIFLTITYLLQEDHNKFLWPGSRDLMTGYLVKRPPPPEPPEEAPTADNGTETAEDKPVVVAKKERNRHRTRTRTAHASESAVPKKVLDSGLLKHRDQISELGNRGFDKDLGKALSRLQDRTASGPGPGRPGGGDGDGDGLPTRGGPGGGDGGGPGGVIATGDIDTGGERAGNGGRHTKPREVAVQIKSGDLSGDLGDITKTEIDNVVKSRSGLYRSCYQKQLNRSPHLAGKLVVRFHITPDGKVKSAKVVRDKSTLHNGAVEDCVLRHIQRLSFPAKGGALVNYPLFFSQG